MDRLAIGIWPHGLTPDVIAMLEPAASLTGDSIEAGPAWTVWTIHEGSRLIAAANVRRTVDRSCDVVLVSGGRFREWIDRLDDLIGRWARDEGCLTMTARGRAGWIPVLRRWRVVRRQGRLAEFERTLDVEEVEVQEQQ